MNTDINETVRDRVTCLKSRFFCGFIAAFFGEYGNILK